MVITIAAVADIHSPKYLPLFTASVNDIRIKNKAVDLIIFAGDVVDKNSIHNLNLVIMVAKKLTNRCGNTPQMIAVFGNEEYIGFEHEYVRKYPEITWINDELKVLNINNVEICIVGSRGVLMQATAWQRKNLPNIDSVYANRVEKIKEHLKICKNYSFTILVTHYASSYTTVYGEPSTVYKFLGFPLIDTIDKKLRPNIAVHGHAHNALVTSATIDGTAIYNVSLPANKKVTIIEASIHI